MNIKAPLSSQCWPLSSAAAPSAWPELCYWSSAFLMTLQSWAAVLKPGKKKTLTVLTLIGDAVGICTKETNKATV